MTLKGITLKGNRTRIVNLLLAVASIAAIWEIDITPDQIDAVATGLVTVFTVANLILRQFTTTPPGQKEAPPTPPKCRPIGGPDMRCSAVAAFIAASLALALTGCVGAALEDMDTLTDGGGVAAGAGSSDAGADSDKRVAAGVAGPLTGRVAAGAGAAEGGAD